MARHTAGGAAAASGMDFQHRVSAWMAVRILAEKGASPLWDLPVYVTLEWLKCETGEPVDDLLVGTSAGGHVFCQIKHRLELSKAPNSRFASVLEQFVHQFIARQQTQQPLDPQKDRLVLITSSNSPETVRIHLRSVLDRIRSCKRESLEDLPRNRNERRALSIVDGHIRRFWQNVLGNSLSTQEIRQLLSLVYIFVLDVDEGGDQERDAKTLLRTVVLRNPDDADVAWSRLISSCAHFAATRSGADRLGFQQILLHAGIELQSPRSYQEDIEKLKDCSRRTFSSLAHLARIRVGSIDVKIHRRCVEELRRMVEEHSLLVVGEPGVGKSGALHDLVEALEDEGRDFVYLAVDRLAAQSLGELRQELGLEHDLTEVLMNWPGTRPAFLVIDALDAARGEPAAKTMQDLIRTVIENNNRWRVVASIRKFDLRYGLEFQELFYGEPPTGFQDPDFQKIRHLNIPKLSDEELNQIANQAPELHSLVTNAPEELRELLQVPFNLQLVAGLLGEGVTEDELTPIRTQLELLDRYWQHRVIRQDRQGGAREALLRRVCNQMVKARTLRIDRSNVEGPATSIYLDDLLRTQVLVEWQPTPTARPDRYVLAFSHHVLFDYAVARLLFRGTPESFVGRLADDPELVLVVRPSLTLHFRHIWMVDRSREQFWNLVLRVIQEDQIPEIGKLIGPSVAAEEAKALSDLEPLCEALDSSDGAIRTAAERAFYHLIGSLVAIHPDGSQLLGPDAGPWCALLERVSRNLRKPVANTIRLLLSSLCEHPEKFTPEQRDNAGKTARRLLEFAWSMQPRDRWLVIHALQSVCRTFESDPDASVKLLRRCIEPEHISQYGFEEMFWLAEEVKRLITLDPAFVEEVYRAAFAHQETSTEPTPMYESGILPLVSNRQQNYGGALYTLAEAFPKFLEHDSSKATRALIAVMEAYVAQRHATASGEIVEETFDFNGRQARSRVDLSCVWDEGDVYRHDEPLRMLDAFEKYLERLAEQEEGREEIRELVRILVEENRLAVLWRRLLFLGARFPDTLGKEIRPLAWAIPILVSPDTSYPAGEFLKAIFPLMTSAERRRVERAILSIPDASPADRRETAERIRDRLLGYLSNAGLVTDEAKNLLSDLQSADAVSPNEPPVHFEEVTRPYSEEEYPGDQGVLVDAKPNRRIRELEQPIRTFADKHLNTIPTSKEIADILPDLRALCKALSRADADGVHPKQRDYAWGVLAAACERIARSDSASSDRIVKEFVKTVLLEASRYPEPTSCPEYESQFDEHPSWGGFEPRIEAAQGLILLARHADLATSDILDAVERLSADSVRAVRYHIASRLNVLYRTAPELMWRIIERMCREEQSRGVLQGLITGPLHRLAGAHPERITRLTKQIFDRVTQGAGAKEVRGFCMGIFTGLYIWRDNSTCREIIFGIIADPVTNSDEAGHVLQHLREPLTYGPVDPSDPYKDAVRKRAFDLLRRLLRSAHDRLHQLEEAHAGRSLLTWPKEEQEKVVALLRIIDTLAKQVYYASGAFDQKKRRKIPTRKPLTKEQERFYRESAPLIDELAEIALPSVTHHLLEMLEVFIPLDPRDVFLRIGRIVRTGQRGGYQFESMAADLIVRLVERYLAEYRTLLQKDEECRRTLLEVLDIFVQVGWPEVRRLTYRSDEIFR